MTDSFADSCDKVPVPAEVHTIVERPVCEWVDSSRDWETVVQWLLQGPPSMYVVDCAGHFVPSYGIPKSEWVDKLQAFLKDQFASVLQGTCRHELAIAGVGVNRGFLARLCAALRMKARMNGLKSEKELHEFIEDPSKFLQAGSPSGSRSLMYQAITSGVAEKQIACETFREQVLKTLAREPEDRTVDEANQARTLVYAMFKDDPGLFAAMHKKAERAGVRPEEIECTVNDFLAVELHTLLRSFDRLTAPLFPFLRISEGYFYNAAARRKRNRMEVFSAALDILQGPQQGMPALGPVAGCDALDAIPRTQMAVTADQLTEFLEFVEGMKHSAEESNRKKIEACLLMDYFDKDYAEVAERFRVSVGNARLMSSQGRFLFRESLWIHKPELMIAMSPDLQWFTARRDEWPPSMHPFVAISLHYLIVDGFDDLESDHEATAGSSRIALKMKVREDFWRAWIRDALTTLVIGLFNKCSRNGPGTPSPIGALKVRFDIPRIKFSRCKLKVCPGDEGTQTTPPDASSSSILIILGNTSLRLRIVDSSGALAMDRIDSEIANRGAQLELLRKHAKAIPDGIDGTPLKANGLEVVSSKALQVVRSIFEDTAFEWLVACAWALKTTYPKDDPKSAGLIGFPERTYRRFVAAAEGSARVRELVKGL